MDSKALFVRMRAASGNGPTIARWLRDADNSVAEEPGTRDWFSLSFGENEFAVFDTFAENRSRLLHLLGKVGRGLVIRTFTLLSGMPDIQMTEILDAQPPRPGTRITSASVTLATPLRRQAEDAAVSIAVTLRRRHQGRHDTGWYLARRRDGDLILVELSGPDSPPLPHAAPSSAYDMMAPELCEPLSPPAIAEVLAYKFG